jgi:pilus assembly protein CpaB
MNRQYRTVVVMTIAVVTAALASFGVYTAIQRMPVKQVEVGTVKVVVAAEPLMVGTPLRREQLRVVDWPEKAQVPGAFADPNDVIDRGVIETIAFNEPVTDRKVASKDAGAGLSPVIPQGMRAMSVRVNDVVGVAGYVVPGTRVDLLVTVKDDGSAGSREAMARTVVSNILVLTAGTRTDTEKGKDGKPQPANVVTLAVLPDDAERIALAQSEGKLSLALRNPLDVEQTKTEGIKMAALMRGGALPEPVVNPVTRKVVARPRPTAPAPVAVVAPPPPPPPPTIYRVEAIRGAKRTEEVVN